ncbi:MAG TPA: PaaI family thioesterase [Rhizomicrobium sp.]|nr:PaaI family thioesterase [Rhizomicrobium sp.]
MSAPPGYHETSLSDPFELYTGPMYETGEGAGRRFAFRVGEQHVNKRGALHGGMLMTFADMALGAAVWDATDRAPSVTMNMQTQFLKPAKVGDLVEVMPELTRRTRSLVFMRGDFTVDGEVVFTAASIWKLLGQS